MAFKDFAVKTNPLKHNSSGNNKPKLEWKVGAKFRRPPGNIGDGKIWTVVSIVPVFGGTDARIYGEDSLWTYRSKCTLTW